MTINFTAALLLLWCSAHWCMAENVNHALVIESITMCPLKLVMNRMTMNERWICFPSYRIHFKCSLDQLRVYRMQ